MDRAVLGTDRAPATFCLHAPVVGLEARLFGSSPDAVGHLIEAVLQRLRPELDRLEQDVVLRVARHVLPSAGFTAEQIGTSGFYRIPPRVSILAEAVPSRNRTQPAAAAPIRGGAPT